MDPEKDEITSSCLEIHCDVNETLKELNTQRHSGVLCDVNLNVDGEEFSAHKGVLAANSSFFLAMFTTEMLEKDKARASLKSVSAEAMESLLEFMYTGQIQIHVENVFELLEASSFLFVEKVRKACCQLLESVVDMGNCFTILSIADTFSCNGLSQTVTQYINREFTELAKTETFLKLSKGDIMKFLSSEDIQIENEEQLLDIAIDWINYDLEVRKDSFTELLKLIRLPPFPLPYIQGKLNQKELSESRMVSKLGQATKEVLWAQQTDKVTSRKSCSVIKVLVVAGGCDNSAILNSVCCFIPAVGKWTNLSHMKLPRWRLQMVTLEDKLFVIGGLRDVCVSDPVIPFVERFSGQSNLWDAVEYQPAVHDVELDSFCALSTGRSSVLLVGGLDPKTNRCTSNAFTVELKDGSSSVMPLASLSFPRAGHCLVLSGDHVYAIGGFQTPYPHAIPDAIRSVECYDATKDAWSCVQPMNEGRRFAAAVSLNDKLFIFGGCDGHNVLRSCEVYNTKNNRWQYIAPMRCSRMKHSAVVHAGKVYVVGGVSSNRTGPLLSSVECYIPEENRWTSVPDMLTGRFDHQCYVTNVGYKFIASVIEKPQ
ncbi:hypothetical protein ACROYT_G027777 [Oculina patagonica]